MTDVDKVLVTDEDGVRQMVRRDRDSSIFVVEVDPAPLLAETYEKIKVHPEHSKSLHHKCIGLRTAGQRIGYVPTSSGLYVFNQEGCTLETEDPLTDTDGIPMPLYEDYKRGASGGMFATAAFAAVTLTKDELLGMPVISFVNFGVWVRKFGDRLERNFHNWNNFLTPIYDRKHVEGLIH